MFRYILELTMTVFVQDSKFYYHLEIFKISIFGEILNFCIKLFV